MWDDLFMKYWRTMPLKLKISQNLYLESVMKNNWCNVWKDIPINPKNQFPPATGILRNFFKVFFV